MRIGKSLNTLRTIFNTNLELQDEVPIHSMSSIIVACFCLFKLSPIPHDNQHEIHCTKSSKKKEEEMKK